MATLRDQLVDLAKSGSPKPRNRIRLGLALRNLRRCPNVYAYKEVMHYRPEWLESRLPEHDALEEWESWVIAFEKEALFLSQVRAAKKRFYREVQKDSSPTFHCFLGKRCPNFLSWLRDNTYQESVS
jgi:hypothetical protein